MDGSNWWFLGDHPPQKKKKKHATGLRNHHPTRTQLQKKRENEDPKTYNKQMPQLKSTLGGGWTTRLKNMQPSNWIPFPQFFGVKIPKNVCNLPPPKRTNLKFLPRSPPRNKSQVLKKKQGTLRFSRWTRLPPWVWPGWKSWLLGLMVSEITTWDGAKTLEIMGYLPYQLVSLPDFWTINSSSQTVTKHIYQLRWPSKYSPSLPSPKTAAFFCCREKDILPIEQQNDHIKSDALHLLAQVSYTYDACKFSDLSPASQSRYLMLF